MGFCQKLCVKNKKKDIEELEGSMKIKGKVILVKKGVLDFHDIKASVMDRVHELLGKGVSIQFISAVKPDPGEVNSPHIFPSICLSFPCCSCSHASSYEPQETVTITNKQIIGSEYIILSMGSFIMFYLGVNEIFTNNSQ